MINFTKEHFQQLVNLVAEAAMTNMTINTKMGAPLNVIELLHATSIGTLNNIRTNLTNKIRGIEDRDEWIEVDTTELDQIKSQRTLVNLIIGWRRKKAEIEENRRKREELQKKYNEICELQKTPDDKKKELEAEIAALGPVEEFL